MEEKPSLAVSNRQKGKLVTIGVALLALAAFVVILFQLIDSNEADTSIVLQSFTGDLRAIHDPGPYLRAFGTPHSYHKVVAVNFTGNDNATATSTISKIKVRFLDTSLGESMGVARFRLPTGEEDLINLHREFGSEGALISNLLERVVVEAAKASARTMSVEQHYSGGAGQMNLDFDDQLRNGIFVIDQVVESEPETVQKQPVKEEGLGKIGATTETETLRNRQRVLVVKRKGDDGEYIRNKNHLAEYGIAVISASMEDVDYEERVDSRLADQKQAAADEALARQNLKKAQQEAKTAKALGDKAIAEAKANSDKEKIQAEIKAQKEASVAIINAKRELEVARQRTLEQTEILELQKKEAEGLEVLAGARKTAAENALDPQFVFEKKLEAWRDVEIAKYQHMSQAQLVPMVQMGQSQGNNDNALTMLEVLGAKAAVDLGMQFQNIGKPKQ